MPFDFPASPTENQVYNAPGGPSYIYNAPAWRQATPGPVPATGTAQEYNRIVNGAMQHSQEVGIGAAATTSGGYAGDQWAIVFVTSGTPEARILTDPEGNMLRLYAGAIADTAIAAADSAYLRQPIEGNRVADFLFGTAKAKPLVLRFTARINYSSAVISAAVRSGDGSRSFVKNVTLTPTWQDFIIPIPVCTDGTWATDNTVGLWLSFAGMSGSNNIGASEGAWLTTNSIAAPGIGNIMAVANQAMYVKNVGLYLDPNNTGVAPAWVTPDYASELAACMRYWQSLSFSNSGGMRWGGAAGGTLLDAGSTNFFVPMRATSIITETTAGTYTNGSAAAYTTASTGVNIRMTVTAIGVYRYSGPIVSANARM